MANLIRPGQLSSGYELIKQYQKANQNKQLLDILVGSTAQETNAKPITGLKNPSSAIKKVETKNEEDPKRNYTLEDVNDYSRGRLVYPDMNTLKQGVKTFENNVKKMGLKITKTTDYFFKPADGYRGYHVDIKFPNGQTSEIQFHTDQSYANALATHPDHAKFGDEKPADAARQDKLTADSLMNLPNNLAQTISSSIEQQEAPKVNEGNMKAQLVANLGNGI